jgi:hypothetical protein
MRLCCGKTINELTYKQMKQFMRSIIFVISLGVLFFAISCKKDKPDNPTNESIIGFSILHTIDEESLDLDVIKYKNSSNNIYSVINLRYFLSNIYLHKGNDSILLKNYHYVDIHTPKTLSFLSEKPVLSDTYDYISLIIGLNEAQNINGFFVNPPEVNMVWPNPMGGGFHYMQLEGKYDSVGTIKNYNFHTGKLMNTHRYIYIKLPNSSFKISKLVTEINLNMNINEWFRNPNNYDFNVYGEAIMGNASAQSVIQQNGADVFSLSVK